MKKYKSFKVDNLIKHKFSKTITASDNSLFCLLTMNHHPVHIDKEFAKKTIFKKPLVVGTYIFSLVVGMTVNDLSFNAIANLGYKNIKHLKPVFIGDTLTASSKIISIRKSKKNNRNHIIHVETTAKNQKNLNVLKFERHILIK